MPGIPLSRALCRRRACTSRSCPGPSHRTTVDPELFPNKIPTQRVPADGSSLGAVEATRIVVAFDSTKRKPVAVSAVLSAVAAAPAHTTAAISGSANASRTSDIVRAVAGPTKEAPWSICLFRWPSPLKSPPRCAEVRERVHQVVAHARGRRRLCAVVRAARPGPHDVAGEPRLRHLVRRRYRCGGGDRLHRARGAGELAEGIGDCW